MLQNKNGRVSKNSKLCFSESSKYALLRHTAVQESVFDKLNRNEGLELWNVCRMCNRQIQTRTGPSVIWHSSISFRWTNKDQRWMASSSPPVNMKMPCWQSYISAGCWYYSIPWQVHTGQHFHQHTVLNADMESSQTESHSLVCPS